MYSASGCATDIRQAQTPDISQTVNISLNIYTRSYIKARHSLSKFGIILAGLHKQASMFIKINEIQR